MPNDDRVGIGAVNVLAVEQDRPFDPRARVRSCMRSSARRKVDLPQPDGPISAVTCSDFIASEAFLIAWNDP